MPRLDRLIDDFSFDTIAAAIVAQRPVPVAAAARCTQRSGPSSVSYACLIAAGAKPIRNWWIVVASRTEPMN
jgi:hypothetical protein